MKANRAFGPLSDSPHFPGYRLIDASAPDLFERLTRFRFEHYCLGEGLLSAASFEDGREVDAFDPEAHHVAAVTADEQIVGCFRLISGQRGVFPTEETYELTETVESLGRRAIGEVSRLIVVPEFRSTFLLFDLIRSAYHLSRARGLRYWIGCVEDPLLRTLDRAFGSIHRVGEPRFCFNAMNTAFVIDLDAQEEHLRTKHPTQCARLLRYPGELAA